MLIAITDIKHGSGSAPTDEEDTVSIAAGEEVTGLDQEVVDQLIEIGAVQEMDEEEYQQEFDVPAAEAAEEEAAAEDAEEEPPPDEEPPPELP